MSVAFAVLTFFFCHCCSFFVSFSYPLPLFFLVVLWIQPRASYKLGKHPTVPSPFYFILTQSLAKFLQPALNLLSSCFSLLYSWNYRHELLCVVLSPSFYISPHFKLFIFPVFRRVCDRTLSHCWSWVDYLVKVVSLDFFHCSITTFPFVMTQYFFGGRYFGLCDYLSLHARSFLNLLLSNGCQMVVFFLN